MTISPTLSCTPLRELLTDTPHVKWVQPSVDYVYQDIEPPKFELTKVQFMDKKESFVQQQVNALIRDGQELNDRDLHWIFGDIYLTNLYQLLIEQRGSDGVYDRS